MKAIDGKARTISEILKGKRYGIDFYQREYRWQKKQVKELVEHWLFDGCLIRLALSSLL